MGSCGPPLGVCEVWGGSEQPLPRKKIALAGLRLRQQTSPADSVPVPTLRLAWRLLCSSNGHFVSVHAQHSRPCTAPPTSHPLCPPASTPPEFLWAKGFVCAAFNTPGRVSVCVCLCVHVLLAANLSVLKWRQVYGARLQQPRSPPPMQDCQPKRSRQAWNKQGAEAQGPRWGPQMPQGWGPLCPPPVPSIPAPPPACSAGLLLALANLCWSLLAVHQWVGLPEALGGAGEVPVNLTLVH